jgi:hypothetical protein
MMSPIATSESPSNSRENSMIMPTSPAETLITLV